jgi:hypothetical protein
MSYFSSGSLMGSVALLPDAAVCAEATPREAMDNRQITDRFFLIG